MHDIHCTLLRYLTNLSYFSIVSEKKKKELDEAWSDTLIEDGYPFTLGAGKQLDRFWKVAFGGSWRPPYLERIAGPLLSSSFERKTKEVVDALTAVPAHLVNRRVY